MNLLACEACVVLFLAAVVAAAERPAPPTGASLVFTSGEPAAARVRELMAAGEMAKAEAVLKGPSVAGALRDEGLEIIRRTRQDYSLDAAGLVGKLRDSIPDVTAEDVERWRRAGEAQWRMLDGQVKYFRREPANIFRFCDEAKKRRDEHAAKAGKTAPKVPDSDTQLDRHLAEIVAAAERTGRAEVLPVRHKVRHRLTVRPDRPGAKAGSLVRCWLPFPQVYRQQGEVKLIRTSPAEHVLAPNAVDGDPVTGAPQRTVYLERWIEDPAQPVAFEEEFEYVFAAYYPALDESQVRQLPAGAMAGYLAERPPHIVFTPELKSEVARVVGDEANPLARVRKIFHHHNATIRYCAEEEYGIIPSFARHVFERRRGDCGVQAILFITMCRIAGVPARWQSGFETKPWGWNMHDWAEFYVEPWGWLPADPSYGLRKSDDPRVGEFYIGHLDPYRMIVNLDYGSTLHPPKPSLRSEPADFQRGEVEIDGRNLYYDEWEWDVQLQWHPQE